MASLIQEFVIIIGWHHNNYGEFLAAVHASTQRGKYKLRSRLQTDVQCPSQVHVDVGPPNLAIAYKTYTTTRLGLAISQSFVATPHNKFNSGESQLMFPYSIVIGYEWSHEITANKLATNI